MKRISIFITVFLLFTLRAESQIKVEASETVELMSVLSRTAGFREYCMDMAGQYLLLFPPLHFCEKICTSALAL